MRKDLSKKPASPKAFRFFKGVCFCLLAVSLTLGIGYPAKGITFPFVFGFGWFSYLFYIFLYIEGFSMIFLKRSIKLKSPFRVIGSLIILFGLLLLASIISHQIINKDSVLSLETFSKNFVDSDFWHNNKLNMFAAGYGGGAIGAIVAGAFISSNIFVGYFLVGMIILIGISIFVVPWILNSQKKKAEKKPEPEKEEEIEVATSEEYDPIKISSSGSFTEKIIESRNINQSFSKPSGSIIETQDQEGNNAFVGNGAFVKARIHSDIPSPVVQTIVKEEPKVEDTYVDTVIEEPIVESEINEDAYEESISLNAVHEDTISTDRNLMDEDLSIFTKEPIYQEPEDDISQSVVPQNEIKEEPNFDQFKAKEPVVEQPKVKKPIVWIAPSSELLDVAETAEQDELNNKTALERQAKLNEIFADFGVRAEVASFIIGPSVTRYNVKYDPNVSVKSIEKIVDDLSRRLGGVMVRFEPVVQGSYYSGIEVPNAVISTVSFKEVFDALPDVKKHPLAVAFGKNISGEVVSADFNEFPHILVAGTTGSGKSIFIHSLISTLIMRCSPDTLRLGLIDPKKVEMVRYKEVPHLLRPILTDPRETKVFLDKLVEEMNERYSKFEQADGATSLDEYNDYAKEHNLETIPYIVIIVDEYGDLVESCKEVAQPILLLGQKARACGIHMLISTQSPTTSIITGTIKNNLATHVALATANTTQSITILGEGGAEGLLGKGDMLVQSPLVSRVGLSRMQGCYINKKEVNRVVGYLKEHYETIYEDRYMHLEEELNKENNSTVFVASDENGTPSEGEEESKYQSIKAWVMSNAYMSMSKIQGECAVGFNRARRFFSRLQKEGIISYETEGNKGCLVLKHDDYDSDEIVGSDELTSYGD